MSYHVYSTEGLVLRSDPIGDADKKFSILTRELGLVFAFAKSVRSEKTKLGAGLQDLSLSEISFIRGKQWWKITSAVCTENMFVTFRNDKEKLLACARICKLLETLITGEEIHIHFFDVIRSGIDFLKKSIIRKDDILLWESTLVLRILFNLGYIARNNMYETLFDDLRWDNDVIALMKKHKTPIIRDINKSLLATQLS